MLILALVKAAFWVAFCYNKIMYPLYLNLSKKEINQRIKKLFKILEKCEICPRKCHVNRLKNGKGFCKLGTLPMVSAYHPHFGEESPLVGTHGSGTIFLTSCNLACVYCQNYDISQLRAGEQVSFKKLAEMMIDLQNRGCHNINFVTPTPQVPQIVKSLSIAIDRGLKIPLVYNTNAYDSLETLKLLDGLIDIYLPDTKYSDDKIALKYSNAPGYFEIMKAAIKEMYKQVGELQISNDRFQIPNIPKGVAIKGLLVRHLVLPNGLAGSKKIFELIAQEISKNTFVNIMNQYTPYWKASVYSELSRQSSDEEFKEAISLAEKAGLKRLYF